MYCLLFCVVVVVLWLVVCWGVLFVVCLFCVIVVVGWCFVVVVFGVGSMVSVGLLLKACVTLYLYMHTVYMLLSIL